MTNLTCTRNYKFDSHVFGLTFVVRCVVTHSRSAKTWCGDKFQSHVGDGARGKQMIRLNFWTFDSCGHWAMGRPIRNIWTEKECGSWPTTSLSAVASGLLAVHENTFYT